MFAYCLLPALLLLTFFTSMTLQEAHPTISRFISDYTFSKLANGYLKYQEIPTIFKEARLRCLLEGATLASPFNYRMEGALFQLMYNKSTKGILTGIHATVSRGDFFSVKGVPLSRIPHRWAEDEPNNLNNQESCIKLDSDIRISDVNCEEPLPYVCYKKAGKYQLNECGTVDNEYHLDKSTGSCYKFHTVSRTWSRAYMTCAAEGGHLAVINSESEAQVIKEIFAKYPGEVIKAASGGINHVAHIGFHDWSEHGEWLTIEGESLKDAGYDIWEKEQHTRNNMTKGQFCGSVERSGGLNDMRCENLLAFICEKERN